MTASLNGVRRPVTEEFALIDADEWGHKTKEATAEQIVDMLVEEVHEGLATWLVLSFEGEVSNDRSGFRRALIDLPISSQVFELFFNSRSGYRAQYAHSEANGERYNQFVVRALVPLLLEAGRFGEVDQELCRASMNGPHTKVWFPKEVTSVEYAEELLLLDETIRVGRWQKYWKDKPTPRKGLVAPAPINPAILLNGSFVDPKTWEIWDQKPYRSHQIAERGWT